MNTLFKISMLVSLYFAVTSAHSGEWIYNNKDKFHRVIYIGNVNVGVFADNEGFEPFSLNFGDNMGNDNGDGSRLIFTCSLLVKSDNGVKHSTGRINLILPLDKVIEIRSFHEVNEFQYSVLRFGNYNNTSRDAPIAEAAAVAIGGSSNVISNMKLGQSGIGFFNFDFHKMAERVGSKEAKYLMDNFNYSIDNIQKSDGSGVILVVNSFYKDDKKITMILNMSDAGSTVSLNAVNLLFQ